MTVFRDLCSMTLQNPDFYPWFYAVFSFQKLFTTFWVVAELRVHFCWQRSTQKNDIMIFQTNWILIFIQPSQKWGIIIKQFASCQNASLSRKYTFFKVPTLVNCVALGKAMNTEKGGPFYIQNELIWICNETNEEGHRQVLIPPFSFAYSETISHWSLGCRDSHVRGVRGQPDVPDLGCSSRSCHNVV